MQVNMKIVNFYWMPGLGTSKPERVGNSLGTITPGQNMLYFTVVWNRIHSRGCTFRHLETYKRQLTKIVNTKIWERLSSISAKSATVSCHALAKRQNIMCIHPSQILQSIKSIKQPFSNR